MGKRRKTERTTGRTGGIRRRAFLGGALAAATFTIVPRRVLGGSGQVPPSERLNVAKVGCGGMGHSDLRTVSRLGCNIVAMCDVDERHAAKAYGEFPDPPKYRDFRVMLEELDDSIDAVVVSTPDHTHAVASMMAIRMGKHVYCQKPLTRTVHEARALTEAAREHGVVTQMGNQGHGGEALRRTAEYIRAGAIGTVSEVHVWTDRPVWKQNAGRPQDTPQVPATLDWDLWLGPAPDRPYHSAYLPFSWRGWWDFGTGALGDMACHNMDPAFYVFNLKYPASVTAECPAFSKESFPQWSVIEWEFPAEGDRPALKLVWHDGKRLPPRPEELEPGRGLGDNGILFVGDRGKMLGGGWAGGCRIIPEAKMREFPPPEKTLPRSIGHYDEWVEACKGSLHDGRRIVTASDFDYAGPMTETILLGNVALRFRGQKLAWDGEGKEFAEPAEANRLLHYEYRKGWTL